MSDPNFTIDEIWLAADRFEIEHHEHGSRMCLADDFLEAGRHLTTIEDCCRYVRSAIERGYNITIKMKVPYGSDRVSEATSE